MSIAVIVLTLTVVLLGHFGIAGVGLAFLIGQGVVSMVVFPSVRRQYRHPEMAPDYASGATLVARSPGQSIASTDVTVPVASRRDAPGAASNAVRQRRAPAALRRRLTFWRAAD